MNNTVVPMATVAGIIFTLTIASILPLAALIFMKIKYKASLAAALVGGAGFVTFALILEQILHTVVIPLVSNSPLLFVVYACLAAGVFEETSRYVGLQILKKANVEHTLPNAIMYGIGHGGIEAVILVGMVYINNLILAISINSVGLEKLSAEAGENAEMFELVGKQFASVSSGMFFVAGFERILAMALHIALTLLMWLCVTKKGPKALYPVCILLHAVANAGAAMSQSGIMNNVVIIYLILGIAVLAAFAIFFKLYKKPVLVNQ